MCVWCVTMICMCVVCVWGGVVHVWCTCLWHVRGACLARAWCVRGVVCVAWAWCVRGMACVSVTCVYVACNVQSTGKSSFSYQLPYLFLTHTHSARLQCLQTTYLLVFKVSFQLTVLQQKLFYFKIFSLVVFIPNAEPHIFPPNNVSYIEEHSHAKTYHVICPQ